MRVPNPPTCGSRFTISCRWYPALVFCLLAQSAAGEFRNLDFELANTNGLAVVYDGGGYNSGWGPSDALLPNWTVTLGNSPVTNVFYNDYPSGDDYVEVFDTSLVRDVMNPDGFSLSVSHKGFDTFTFTQKGELPADIRYLSYTAALDAFSLRIDGVTVQPLDINTIAFSDRPRLVSYDVSPFAGREVTLSLIQLGGVIQGGSSSLDNIVFSIPEPSSVHLLLVAGFGVCSLGVLGRGVSAKRGSDFGNLRR